MEIRNTINVNKLGRGGKKNKKRTNKKRKTKKIKTKNRKSKK